MPLSPDDASRIAPYVSNLDRDVFALAGLPEEVVAVLFAYYSRSRDDLRTNLAKLLVEDELGGEGGLSNFRFASEKAKADARKGGTEKLVGANLFREFRQVEPGKYKGRVFVPDMNRTFSGQMRIEGNAMIGKGCVLGFICKSQTWTRIS